MTVLQADTGHFRFRNPAHLFRKVRNHEKVMTGFEIRGWRAQSDASSVIRKLKVGILQEMLAQKFGVLKVGNRKMLLAQ